MKKFGPTYRPMKKRVRRSSRENDFYELEFEKCFEIYFI